MKIRDLRQHQKRIGKALGIPKPKVAGSNPAGDVQEPQGFDSNPCGFFVRQPVCSFHFTDTKILSGSICHAAPRFQLNGVVGQHSGLPTGPLAIGQRCNHRADWRGFKRRYEARCSVCCIRRARAGFRCEKQGGSCGLVSESQPRGPLELRVLSAVPGSVRIRTGFPNGKHVRRQRYRVAAFGSSS
jgi:hypothetical protein